MRLPKSSKEADWFKARFSALRPAEVSEWPIPMGNVAARFVLVTSHWCPNPGTTNGAFNTEAKNEWLRIFSTNFANPLDLDENSFLVFPASRFGKKPTVASVDGTKSLCVELARRSNRTFIFCGALEFGLTINGYRKKASNGLYGALMYLPEFLGCTVSVLPTEAELIPASEDWKDVRNAQYYQEALAEYVTKLRRNYEKHADHKA